MTDPKELLARLDAGLSGEEQRAVLAAALLALDEPGRKRLHAALDADTAATLREILHPPASPTHTAAARSENRIEQEWCEVWSLWDDVIAESSDEVGRFMEQEEPWHPPCLDVFSIADELEEVASRLLPLLPEVQDRRFVSDFDLLEKVGEDIEAIGAGLPEWFGGVTVEGLLGPQLSACLLRWDCPDPGRAGSPFPTFQRIRLREADSERWSLHEATLLSFVGELPEETQKGLLRDMQAHADEPLWAAVLTRSGSAWFDAFRELARRWDPAAELSICRMALESDWSLAVPVLEDLLESGAFEEAEIVAGRAFAALLRPRVEHAWDPLASLLVGHPMLSGQSTRLGQIATLAGLAARAAAGVGDQDRVAALDGQAFLLGHWERWDAVLEYLRALGTQSSPLVAERIFELWLELVSSQAHRASGFVPQRERRSWIPQLGRALWRRAPGEAVSALGSWVEQAGSSAAEFKRHLSGLELLTSDLGLAGAVPALLARLPSDRSPCGASRREQLVQAGCQTLIPSILATWVRHAALLVPDPGETSGSRYEDHAAWLAVVRELDPTVYSRIVADWRQRFHRRRNLWLAIRAAGLPA